MLACISLASHKSHNQHNTTTTATLLLPRLLLLLLLRLINPRLLLLLPLLCLIKSTSRQSAAAAAVTAPVPNQNRSDPGRIFPSPKASVDYIGHVSCSPSAALLLLLLLLYVINVFPSPKESAIYTGRISYSSCRLRYHKMPVCQKLSGRHYQPRPTLKLPGSKGYQKNHLLSLIKDQLPNWMKML